MKAKDKIKHMSSSKSKDTTYNGTLKISNFFTSTSKANSNNNAKKTHLNPIGHSSSGFFPSDKNLILSDDSDVEIIALESAPKDSSRKLSEALSKDFSSNLSSCSGTCKSENIEEIKSSISNDNHNEGTVSMPNSRISRRLSLKRKISISSTHVDLNSESGIVTDSSKHVECASQTSEKIRKNLSNSNRKEPRFLQHVEDNSDSRVPVSASDNSESSITTTTTSLTNLIVQPNASQNQVQCEIAKDDVSSSTSVNAPELRLPYYLVNFKTVLKIVTEDESFSHLFDPTDNRIIEQFSSLSGRAITL